MGNQLAGIAPSQIYPVEYYLADLLDYSHDANLGSTRFFKVARARYKEGLTVVKVFAIHDPTLPLRYHKDRIEEIRDLFNTVPHCLPFQRCILTDKAGILIRQFVKDNLYDRISTRPFLNGIEKRWIAFQLLQCLNTCHKKGVCHGDIKLENIMVTSWNWVMVTDFASFKPTYLPEDNPADFSYFFDTSRRRTCYIAPERFVKTLNSDNSSNSTTSLILPDDQMKKGDLTPAMDIFSLGCVLTELFTEGHSPFDFSQLLAYRSGEYTPWKVLEKIDDLHIQELVRSMMEKESWKRSSIEIYLQEQYDKAFPAYFYTFLEDYIKKFASQPIVSPDEKVHRLKKDIDNIIQSIIPVEQNTSSNNNYCEGLVLIVPLLTSSLRALKHCTAKLKAFEILKTLATYLSPDIILDRLLPYMLSLIEDQDPKVRVGLIQTLTECLKCVKSLPRSDSNIFPEYILPNLVHVAQDEAVIVRMAYAENIALLAETALRFLEMMQIETDPEPDNTCTTEVHPPHSQVSYDHELQTLQELVQQSVTILLSDPVNAVKQTLLERGITRLCIFFGRQKGNDVLLSHMITYLNDKDDRYLRGAFFDAIVGVTAYVGWQCCPIIKPLLQQGLTDSEEFVISKALHTLLDLSELGLIQKQMLYDLVAESIPLLIHPNLWIKQGAVGFVCAVARCLNLADVQCRLLPLLQPFLKHSVIQVEQEFVLLNAVQDPLPRCIFDYLMKLNGLKSFLDSLNNRKIIRSIARAGHHPEYRELNAHLKTIYCRLQSDGMTVAIEDQILAMEDYLLKVHAKKCSTDAHNSSSERAGGIVDLGKVQSNPKMCSILLADVDQLYEKSDRLTQRKRMERKNYSGVESPTVMMNQEWQHMFGSTETKSPSSPKLVSQGSDPMLVQKSTPKELSTGENTNVNKGQAVEPTSDNFNPKNVFSITEHHLKPNFCVPCQEELHSLIQKKQEEWVHDEIIREGCETSVKDEQVIVKHWKPPSGCLIAHLHEHKRSVNKVLPFPDSTLFATCSNDMTVKVWDCEKMEGKNIANRSKLTYSRMNGPVTCIAMCQNMQSIAAASEAGNIHVFRIAADSSKSPTLHSRTLDLQEEGAAVDLHYFDTGSQSVLSYATIYGSIIGWDLRSPGTAWKLESHPRFGLVTSFCVDPWHSWLCLGTANGKLICWDLRFQLPIATVSHPTGARIRHVLLHPKHQSAVLAAVQGNNEVSMWDIETQARIKTLWASTAPPLSQVQATDHSVYSMCWVSNEKGSALLTGGSDMAIRYWDLKTPENSSMVVNAANDSLSNSAVSYKSRLIDGTEVIHEVHKRLQTTDSSPCRYPETPPAGHYDCISGVCTVQTSQTLIVSASKNGVVKVWK